MSDIAQRLSKLSPDKRRLLEERMRRDPDIAEPIAIVGMACRFPGAATLSEYWRIIHDGIDATGEIPKSRWDVDGLYDPTGQLPGKMSVRWAGLVDGIEQFDPQFFGISPREAARMDPQQRLLLEVGWEALENACMPADSLAGSATGVFVGIGGTDYSKVPAQFDDYLHHIDAHVGTGNALSIAANRLSYIFDFRGPSLAVDTACSSSTMGIHMAMQSLRSRECNAALAGGVNAILTPETTIAFSKAKMLSPDGKCRPFDASANGYVRGEGCGLLVLKRLTDALADGDPVLAVIRASATNQDGRTSGITAPSGLAQQATIRAALKQAGLKQQQIEYIEAHGTGTPLGDPIEMEALGQVFQGHVEHESPCYVTSVKANVGHMETVSGVAGLIKVVLMMKHHCIPGQLYMEQLNPRISLEGTRIIVPSQPVPWPAHRPLLAGVSSFGFGGANTHVIVESASLAEKKRDSAPERSNHLLPLSAKSEAALRALASKYRDFLQQNDASIADVAHTAGAGRSHLPFRAAAVAEDRDQLIENLQALADDANPGVLVQGPHRSAGTPRVAFLFTGQGSQYPRMAKELYETQPVFREILDRCQDILADELDVPLLSLFFPDAQSNSGNGSGDHSIHETCYTQPALFVLEYALAELWRSWGIEPQVVMGHSVGEYAAACVAGILDLEDGLRLIARRGRLMHSLPKSGAMAVIFAGPPEVEAVVNGQAGVDVAAYNGPQNTVISGEAAAVRQLVEQFEAKGISTKALQVSHAFHSAQMDPILDEFERFAESIDFRAPRIPLIANLSGKPVEDWGPKYLREHIRKPVQFTASMAALEEMDLNALLEVGPTASLTGMGRRCLPDLPVSWLPSLRKGQSDWRVLLSSLGELYTLGANIQWKQFDQPWSRRWLPLPTYPFRRERFWLDEGEAGRRDLTGTSLSFGSSASLLGSQLVSPLSSRLFQSAVSPRHPDYLADHCVQHSIVFPAAGYLEVALQAAAALREDQPVYLRNIAIQQAMFLEEGQRRRLHTTVSDPSSGLATWEIYSSGEEDGEKWTLHASGQMEFMEQTGGPRDPLDLATIRERLPLFHTGEEFYKDIMAERQLDYGPAFQVLANTMRSGSECLAEIGLAPAVSAALAQHQIHPALGDALFQTAAGLIPFEEDGSYSPYTYMPTGVREVRVHAPLTENMFSYGVRTSTNDKPSPDTVEGDLTLTDDEGRVLVEFLGICIRRVGAGAAAGADKAKSWVYDVAWRELEIPEESSEVHRADVCLILSNKAGWAGHVASALRAAGQPAYCVRQGAGFRAQPEAGWDFEVNPLSSDDYVQLLDALGEQVDTSVLGCEIVHAWSLDLDDTNRLSDDFSPVRTHGCGSLLQLLHAMATPRSLKLRLTLVTRGAHPVTGQETMLSPAQASLWGMGRVASIEYPEFDCRLVDLDTSCADSEIGMLCEDLLHAESDQLAYRRTARWTPHLLSLQTIEEETADEPVEVHADSRMTIPESGPFQLRLRTAGSFDGLAYEPSPRGEVEPGQVEVRVAATGLNFSDVLKAMGLYPGIKDDVVPLGIECAGVVTAVGEGVEQFRAGDRVMGIAPYSFASHVRTADYCLVPLPEHLSPTEAVTIPITFLTAHHGLVRLADMQPGERVLIHAGAGGVGLAAIQIAHHVGATVFATAGSDVKRKHLRALGVEHVFSSRNLDFVGEIKRITQGEGVDVVLNSLPGEAIPASLSLLRAYGRFLEIGKTDIYQNRMLGLEPFQDNLSYFAIDLDRMLRQRPAQITQLFAEVMSAFEAGVYTPLDATVFEAAETVDAFRYMAKRQNIGKVVVRLDTDAARDEADAVIKPAGTCLITGGLGALGLRMAKAIRQGAFADENWTHVALLSRRLPDDETCALMEQLKNGDGGVCALQGDVGDLHSLETALGQIPNSFPPVRGVFHSAGALADGLLLDMDLEKLEVPLKAKVDGTWNLHQATASMPVQQFVMFSSIACLLGSPGQGNYAAANAFLDSFAAWRHKQGLPAISINWGPWAESGMAAQDGTDAMLKARGMRLMAPDTCLHLLEDLLRKQRKNAAVLDVDWPLLLRSYAGHPPSILSRLNVEDAGDREAGSQVDHEFLAQLEGADHDTHVSLLGTYFTSELARIMGLKKEQLDDKQPLNELGLDSLLAMELKNNLEQRLDFTLPMAAFMNEPSISSLAGYAAGAMGHDESAPSPQVSWSPLVRLQPDGSQEPLICLHPLGGDIGCYRGLAQHFGAVHPLWAIQGRGNDGEMKPDTSLDAMIGNYADTLVSQAGASPYILAGWSAGGIYAYELVRALLRRGADVQQLILLDAPMPMIYDNVELNDHARFLADFVEFANNFLNSNMHLDYEDIRSLDENAAFAAAMREAEAKNVVAGLGAESNIRHLVEVGKTHARFMKGYQLEPINLPVHLILPRTKGKLEQVSGQKLPEDLGWGQLLGDKLHIHHTDGDHFSMMLGDHLIALSDLLHDLMGRPSEKLATSDASA